MAYEEGIRSCQRLGAEIVELETPWNGGLDDLNAIQMSELWVYHRSHELVSDRYRPAVAEFIRAARSFTDAQAYLEAQARRAHGTQLWEEWWRANGVDLILEPTVPIVPHERGHGCEASMGGGPGDPTTSLDPMISLTVLWDLTGMPVAALPVSWQAGLSMVAPHGREDALVQAAIDLQEHALGVPDDPASLA